MHHHSRLENQRPLRTAPATVAAMREILRSEDARRGQPSGLVLSFSELPAELRAELNDERRRVTALSGERVTPLQYIGRFVDKLTFVTRLVPIHVHDPEASFHTTIENMRSGQVPELQFALERARTSGGVLWKLGLTGRPASHQYTLLEIAAHVVQAAAQLEAAAAIAVGSVAPTFFGNPAHLGVERVGYIAGLRFAHHCFRLATYLRVGLAAADRWDRTIAKQLEGRAAPLKAINKMMGLKPGDRSLPVADTLAAARLPACFRGNGHEHA